jgi:preprotein translocase SecE subunit
MPAFEIYKPEMANRSRWLIGVCGAAWAIYGAYHLFSALPDRWREHAFSGFRPLGEEFPLSWAFILSLLMGLGLLYGVWRAVNLGRLVEFLGETEVEMTKVSWSSQREVVGSSLVVIVTVVILGVWIAAVDIVLSMPWGAWIGGTIGRLFR